ncbi:hypothetical protein [Clostridium sp.]|uniref:hypothetical protein n=1 Tax=Clostridium sp. TaxID=1506 RepID=UPI00399559B6
MNNIMKKTHGKSFIRSFHRESELGKNILSANPNYRGQPATILQIMLEDNKCYLAEIILLKDYTEVSANEKIYL